MKPFEGSTATPVQIAAERTIDLLTRRLPGESRPTILRAVSALVDLLEAGESEGVPELSPVVERVVRPAARVLSAELIRSWRAAPSPPNTPEVLRSLDLLQRVEAPPGPLPDDLESQGRSTPLDLVVEFAHDLRSPLTSILFLSETLRRSGTGDLNPIQHRQIGIIYSAALNLVSLSTDVIDLARGGDRLMDRQPAQFSIREILDSVCEIVAPLVEEKKVSIRTVAPPVDVRLGYPVAVSRILLNLLSNALRFTSEGYVEITAQAIDATVVEFVVRDTGTGFDPEREETLKTGDVAGRAIRFGFAGSGLGLTICRRLLRAMESELHYETDPAWGTRFHFRLRLPPPDLT